MIFSYNWLQSFFNKKLPKPEKLAEILAIRSFEVEEIRKSGKDWVLDVDILPNRVPDCACYLGLAREIGAITKLKVKNEKLKIKVKSSKLNIKNFLNVEVADKKSCSRYTARMITGVKVGLSPKWMQERLKICGLQPINNVVDAANYVMLETGQPLHAFDFEKIKGKTIIVRKAKRGEEIITLDGSKYELDENILVIADSKEPLAIAGIKGGKKAEIDENTKTIVLEAANFEPQIIRRGSKLLNLKTDASYRFEHGLDPNLTEAAINKATSLIQEISHGKIANGLLDFYPKKVLPKIIKLDLVYIDKLLGVKISKKEIIKILKSLGLNPVESGSKAALRGSPPLKAWFRKILNVGVPTFRLDISIPEDLIEEIARIFGYEKINGILPTTTLIPPQKNDNLFWQGMVKNILKEVGFAEVYNYSFISPKQVSNFKLQIPGLLEVENPVSVEQKYLRPSLIPNLLKNIQKNQEYFEKIKVFEIGKIFIGKNHEKTSLAGVITTRETKQGFYELKGIVDLLLNKLGISDIWYNECSSKKSGMRPFEQCAVIKINREEIGFLAGISEGVLRVLKIKQRVVAFNIDFERLAKQCSEEQVYQPISAYPAAVRDIAVLVPRKVKVVEVLNKINTAGGKLIMDVDVFDIYEGEELPEGKKNFAFHIIYQAKDRTLTAKEIDAVHQKIAQALESQPSWEVRK